jgi:hypothetical protein
MHMITNRSAGESISALPVSRSTRSRSYRRGRVCGAAGCSTVLSVYNPSALCSIHGSPHSVRV